MEISTESIKNKLNDFIKDTGCDITTKVSRFVGSWDIVKEVEYDDAVYYNLTTNGVTYKVVYDVNTNTIQSVDII